MRPSSVWRRVGAAAVFVAISGGLFGCVAQPTPLVTSASPSVSETQSPAPVPSATAATPAAPAAGRVHIEADALSVLGADGTVLDSFQYRQLTAEVVAGLNSHLGEPTVERFAEGNHNGEGARFIWESLVVSSEDRWAELSDDELPTSVVRWFVSATGPTANGVAVDTVDGIRVGDSTEEVLAAHPGAGESIVPGSGLPRVDIFLGSVPPPYPVDTGGAEEARWRVFVYDEEPTDVLQGIGAPSLNYGA